VVTAAAASAGESGFRPTDWPQFRGPFGNGRVESEQPLVDDLNEAKLVWIGEERNIGVGWSLGHGSARGGNTPWRAWGYSGPVVAHGRAYLQYFEPTGDAVDRQRQGNDSLPSDARRSP
jgi:hypothetical protein